MLEGIDMRIPAYEERKKELFVFIEALKKKDDSPVADLLSLRTTMRATAVLLLYNMVEFTVTYCLRYIHDMIKEHKVPYREMTKAIQNITITYYVNKIKMTKGDYDTAAQIRHMLAQVNDVELSFMTYDEFAAICPLYSGNLDSKVIRSVLKKYGICSCVRSRELKTVREKRNRLAHGEDTFEEIGRDLSIEYVETLMNSTFEAMETMIEEVGAFIAERSYMSFGHESDENNAM